MGIREAISKRPTISYAVAGVGLFIAALGIWSALRPDTAGHLAMPTRLYFSDDDGKGFFVDSSSKIPPYDHAGKTAVGAAIFQCGKKPPFVGYLIRFNNSGKTALNALPESARGGASAEVMAIKQSSEEVKKPGDRKWTTLGDSGGLAQILRPACPDGDSEEPKQIVP